MSKEELKSVADQLVAHCKNGTEAEGLKTLYHAEAVSVEGTPMPGSDSAETNGVEAIQGKHDWWASNFEVHRAEVEGPMLHGEDRFAVIFNIDATDLNSKERWAMKEVGIYTVKNGKIVREEFFY